MFGRAPQRPVTLHRSGTRPASRAPQRQIYDEFHRFEQPFDWDGRGLGLGLSICQRISRLLDHTLDARSVVGHGSMFSILVPRGTPGAGGEPRRDAPRVDVDQALHGMTVLCVDNDRDILSGMHALLSRWGIRTVTAPTVDEALERLSEQPDVLLVDSHLHDRLDGLDISTRCVAPPAARCPAPCSRRRQRCVKRGARRSYRVLTKPVKLASLRAFLAAQLPRVDAPRPDRPQSSSPPGGTTLSDPPPGARP